MILRSQGHDLGTASRGSAYLEVGGGRVHLVQGTVAEFDPQTRGGALLLDDGRRVEFAAAAFDASGLRLLRPGQRVQVDRDQGGNVTRITIPTMRGQ